MAHGRSRGPGIRIVRLHGLFEDEFSRPSCVPSASPALLTRHRFWMVAVTFVIVSAIGRL